MPAPGANSADAYSRALSYANQIIDELKKLNALAAVAPPEEAFRSSAAFLADTMTFFQWLQFVLVPRIQQVALEGGTFPSTSSVGAYAVRELDGLYEAAPLVSLLSEFDTFIEGLSRGPSWGLKEAVNRFLETIPNQVYTELRQIDRDAHGWWAHVLLVVRTRRARETEVHAALRLVKSGRDWDVDVHASVELTARFRTQRAAALSQQAAAAFSNGNAEEGQRLLGEAGQVANQATLTEEMLRAREEPVTPLEFPKIHLEPIRLGQQVEEKPVAAPEKPPPQPAVPDPATDYPSAREMAEKCLRALIDGGGEELVSPKLIEASGRDVELAERVFRTINSFEECIGKVEMAKEGPIVNAIVRAERGLWVVRVAFWAKEAQAPEEEELLPGHFRPAYPRKPRQKPEDLVERLYIEPHLSYLRTTDFYLRQHHIHPPFAGEGSARGFVMQFWHNLANNRRDWAYKMLTPESRGMELPVCGHGWVDEIVFYIDHREEPLGVVVRVLINTREESRFWHTYAVYRAGEWMIDWPETLRRN